MRLLHPALRVAALTAAAAVAVGAGAGCTSSSSSVKPLPTTTTASATSTTTTAPESTLPPPATAATTTAATTADVTQEDPALKNDFVITADEQAATVEAVKSLGYTNIGLRLQHFTPAELTALAVASCAALGDNPTRLDLGHRIAKRLRVTDAEGSTVWLSIAEYACHDAAAAWDQQAG